MRQLAVVVLAAGEGTRMKSATPKILHEIAGLPLIGHVLSTAHSLGANHVVAVLRHERERIENYVKAFYPNTVIALQDEVPGTGRAVEAALEQLPVDFDGDVAVLSGDVPLLDVASIEQLVEIHREDIPTLPRLLARLKGEPRRFILFCDDLSFDHDDTTYKSLKAVLEGGLEGRPENVIFYATSNRRHLMPREMIDNERASAITPGEAVEEKVSLSDRFGLWLGFHPCTQDDYLDMINGYCAAYGVIVDPARLRAEAIEWQATRGGRSGRVAWQFFCDLAAREGVRV